MPSGDAGDKEAPAEAGAVISAFQGEEESYSQRLANRTAAGNVPLIDGPPIVVPLSFARVRSVTRPKQSQPGTLRDGHKKATSMTASAKLMITEAEGRFPCRMQAQPAESATGLFRYGGISQRRIVPKLHKTPY
jgi:hypothetical protein